MTPRSQVKNIECKRINNCQLSMFGFSAPDPPFSAWLCEPRLAECQAAAPGWPSLTGPGPPCLSGSKRNQKPALGESQLYLGPHYLHR